jgi:hypothetical protein
MIATAAATVSIGAHAEVATQRAREHFALDFADHECVDCDRTPPAGVAAFDYWSTARLTQRAGRDGTLGISDLSDKESTMFSGIGAIVCDVAGKSTTTTAFLVGSFDIVVTVAHTFEHDGAKADPSNCTYTTTDEFGQIRERIPLSYFKSEWELEDGAFGQLSTDLAVVRLSKRSDYAQRTMPLGKFRGGNAPVLMIGFNDDLDLGSIKRKSRGNVFERRARTATLTNPLFTHDMDAANLAAGAPVIDERTGIIIGVHTSLASASRQTQGNAFIPMNDWLEHTLLAEIKAEEGESGAAAKN